MSSILHACSRARALFAHAILLASCLASSLAAQDTKIGIVLVTIQDPMGMVAGLTVRSAGRTASTDAEGMARLSLPIGRQLVSVMAIGYRPARPSVTVVAHSVVSVTIPLERAHRA